jgi:hypothetical protein
MSDTENDKTMRVENPVIVMPDSEGVTIIETTHDEILQRIRAWRLGLVADEQMTLPRLWDLRAMADTAAALIELDGSSLSLENWRGPDSLVNRVTAYAFGQDPEHFTIHWPLT